MSHNQLYNLVALLPIKAHSARIPGKNFRIFAGRPLFQWILETLLEIPQIDRIVINTDARDLLISHGLQPSDRLLIRDRKKSLCGDEVSMNKIIGDDLEFIPASTYLMTHTTNPLLHKTTITRALEAYQQGISSGFDSLFTVNRLQTRFYREDGSPVNHDPDNLIPTQELEPWFEENSNLYLFDRESFRKTSSRIGSRPRMFETPAMESADIDNATGWHLAEIIALSKYIGESIDDYRVKQMK